jgi:hypothetical protein
MKPGKKINKNLITIQNKIRDVLKSSKDLNETIEDLTVAMFELRPLIDQVANCIVKEVILKPLRCIYCGRFIAWRDFETNKASGEYDQEKETEYHWHCACKELNK